MTTTPGIHPSTEPSAPPPSPAGEKPLVLTKPVGWQPIDLPELWHYRELLWFLALRDIKVRYKQTALGAAWAVIQPFMTMVAFSIFFGNLAGIGKKSPIPYPVLTFCALLPWKLFEYALTQSGNSLVSNERLISKVYFPRLVIPIAAVASGLLDFIISFVILLLMMLYYRIVPGWAILTLPLFVALVIAAALAVGLWLSALNVKYRDVRYAIPFIAQFWLFVTPVAYPSSMIPEKWRTLIGLNPMSGVVEGFRWALLGEAQAPGRVMLVSTVVTLLLLIGGLFYFRRMEDSFADLV